MRRAAILIALTLAGRWKATFSSAKGASMTFTVENGGRRLSHVVVRSFLVFCSNDRTALHASTQKYTLRGRFSSATAATGYAEEQSLGGYCVGGSTWRARRR